MRRMPSWSQKIEATTFPVDFCTRNFWGGVSCYATTLLIVALSPGLSGIIRFRPWSPVATGNNLDCAEKIPKVVQTTGTVDVFHPHSGISGPTWRRASACPNLHDWWTQPAHVRCPVCPAIDLAEIRRSSKINSWIWSVISGLVTVLGRPGQGASQVEKTPRLNSATQFLTAYDGECSPNVSVRMAWIFFGALPCRKKKKSMTVRISMLLKLRASPDMLPFRFCNKKILPIRHINRPLFTTTLSIPSYDTGK